jgi:cytochrome c-type biogenesis protein
VLAAQGRDLIQVGLTMLVFAIGAALPQLLLGYVSREALIGWRGRMLTAGTRGKMLLGLALVATSGLILTGSDRLLEAALLRVTPAWLTDVTTRF